MNRSFYLPKLDQWGRFPVSDGSKVVEIGFGNGEFLSYQAQQQPHTFFYGIEVSLTCVGKAVERAMKNRLDNVQFLCGDARFLLRHSFEDQSLDCIYMHFPCPWPKKRHARRRVTAPGFSNTLAAKLRLGGRFEFASDEPWYVDMVADGLSEHPALALIDRKPYQRAITTKYERRWIDEGKTLTHLVFEKQAEFSLNQRSLSQEGDDMLHVRVLGSPFDFGAMVQKVGGQKGGEGDAVWAFRSLYCHNNVALVETVTSDDGYEQKFYLKIVHRDDGLLVKFDNVHHPFLTDAVRGALAHLAVLVEK